MNNRFALDRREGKWMGVCAGIARSTDVDPTIIRLAVVLATLALLGPVALILYFATALVAPNG